MIEMTATGRVVNPTPIRMTANGSPIANFSLACDVGRTTRWVRCTLVGYNTVEELERDLEAVTGNTITVTGRPDAQAYTDQSGNIRSQLVCWVSRMEFAPVQSTPRGSKLSASKSSASKSSAL